MITLPWACVKGRKPLFLVYCTLLVKITCYRIKPSKMITESVRGDVLELIFSTVQFSCTFHLPNFLDTQQLQSFIIIDASIEWARSVFTFVCFLSNTYFINMTFWDLRPRIHQQVHKSIAFKMHYDTYWWGGRYGFTNTASSKCESPKGI